jgi:metal-dependent hydrolase (beta-lactamase superfamily II)
MGQKNVKITVLVDNCVFMPDLKAEHGLSFVIEKDGKKILLIVAKAICLWKMQRYLGWVFVMWMRLF